MNCAGCSKDIPTPKRDQRFCSAKCRIEAWGKLHPRKNLKPKRIRLRERERLYVIIHRGESLAYLREQAMEAVRVQALRQEDDAPVCHQCGRQFNWNAAVDAYEHDDPCIPVSVQALRAVEQ